MSSRHPTLKQNPLRTWVRGLVNKPILLTVILAFIGVAFEGVGGETELGRHLKVGGYEWMVTSSEFHPTDVVLLDQSKYLTNPSSNDPAVSTDNDWKRVIKNWSSTQKMVSALRSAGAKAIVLDYELALRDQYVLPKGFKGEDPFFDLDAIPREAAKANRKLLKSLVHIDHLGTPVVFAASLGQHRLREGGAENPGAMLPVPAAESLAASAESSQPNLSVYVVTSFMKRQGAEGLPSMSDLVVQKLGKAASAIPPLPGFSPYAVELEEEMERQGQAPATHAEGSWRQRFVDFRLVDPHPIVPPDMSQLNLPSFRNAVRGKIVVLADCSRRDPDDSVVIPGYGVVPGGFHQASAIATRLYGPLFAPISPWVEAAYLFLVSVALGWGGLALAVATIHWRKFGHHSWQADWTEVGFEGLTLLVSFFGAIWLATHLHEHHLLLPMLILVVIVRAAEFLLLFWHAATRPKPADIAEGKE